MSGERDEAGQLAMPPTDPGELVQQLKSQLLPSDKSLSKNQRKKARKKVTKILQKALGISPQPGVGMDDDAHSDGEQPPSSKDTACCSNRRAAGGAGQSDPACTSTPKFARSGRAQHPGDAAALPTSSEPAEAAAAAAAAAAATAAIVVAPPPKRRRLDPYFHPVVRTSSDGAAIAAAAACPDGGNAPPAAPAAASQQQVVQACRTRRLCPWNSDVAMAPGVKATAGSSMLTGGSGNGSRSLGGLSAAAAPSGGSSHLSHGARKRLSRRQAHPEDLLTVDDDGDTAAAAAAGLSHEVSGRHGNAAAVAVAACIRGAGAAREGGKGSAREGRDRKQRGRSRERIRYSGATAKTAASEEVIQVPLQAGTAASVAAAAAAAAVAAVHRGSGLYGGAGAFAGPVATTRATTAAAVDAPAAAVLPPLAARAGAAVARGPVDLSAALLLMRVHLRTASDAEGTAAAAAAAATVVTSAVTGPGCSTGLMATTTAVGSVATCSTSVSEYGSGQICGEMGGTGEHLVSAFATAADGGVEVVAAATARAAGGGGSGGVEQVRKHKPQRTEQQAAARAALYRYGNYHRYYGYRLGADLDQDPRVKLMRREWFQQQVVFDVGCNEGLVTLAVAARFGAKRMTGYDIDGTLIKKACRNLRIMRTEYTNRLQAMTLGRYDGGGGGSGGDALGWGDAAVEYGKAEEYGEPIDDVEAEANQGGFGADGGGGADEDMPDVDGGGGAGVSVDSDVDGGDAEEKEGSGGNGDGDVASGGAGADTAPAPGPPQPIGSNRTSIYPHHLRKPDRQQQQLKSQQQQQQQTQGQQQQQQQQTQGQQQQQRQHQSQQQQQVPAAPHQPSRRGPHSAAGPAPLRVGMLRSHIKALSGTRFVQQDWVNARGRPESADTILCLSLTKWVHLNNGDAGLKRLFKKFFDTLTPGGLLVLEPQPWKSYKRAVHKTTTNAVPFKRIEQLQLRPQHFVDYLTSQVGFELESRLHEGEGVGFDRPMYLLRKPSAAKEVKQGLPPGVNGA